MAFDSVFNGDPTTPNVSASGEAAFGIDLATGQLYYRNPQDQNVAGWQECAGSGGGGASVKVNGSTVATPNFNGATPAAPTGYSNIIWQVAGSSVSAYAAASSASVTLSVDSGTPEVIAVGDLVCWGGNGNYGNGDGLIPADNSSPILGVALTSGGASSTISVQISGIATVNNSSMVESELVNATDPDNLGWGTNSSLGDTINDQYLAGVCISTPVAGQAQVMLTLCSAPPTPAPYFLKVYQAQGTVVAGQVVSMVNGTSDVVQACTSTMIPLGIAISVTRFGVTTCIGGVSPINAVMTGAAISPGDFLAVNDSSQVILAQPAPGQTIRTIGIAVDADSAHPGTTDQFIVYVIPQSVTGDSSNSGLLSKATGTITSAQILAFAATPVTIVADPGAGKYIQPWFFTMEFIPNTTPYSIGADQSINLTTVALNDSGGSQTAWTNFNGTGFIDQTVKQLGPNNAIAGAPFPLSAVEHVDLVVLGTGGSATLGDGTIAWTLYYTTETAV
jgi:hypothetical protein